MSHFAQIDENSVVQQVIVADQDFIDSGAVGDPDRWIRTSYNNNIRVRFAGAGFTYDVERDAFIPPKPFPSWVFDEASVNWVAPVPQPEGGSWQWNEETQEWQAI